MEFQIPLWLAFFLFTLLSSSQAYQFTVGGSQGWVPNPSQSYNQWAGNNRFQINDTIVFKYTKGSDSVLEVKKDDYDNCNKTNPIKKFEDGDTVFKFDRSGPFYFISGKDGNCEKGQKLIVVVLSPRTPPSQTPPPKPSPSPPKTSPSPSPISNPPPSSAPTSPSPAGPPPTLSPSPTSSPTPTVQPPATSPAPTGKSPSPSPSATSPSPSPMVPSPTPSPATTSPSPSPISSPPPPPPSSPSSSPSSSPKNSPPAPPPGPTAPQAGPTPSPASNSTAPPPGSGDSSSVSPSSFWVYSLTVGVGVGVALLRY